MSSYPAPQAEPPGVLAVPSAVFLNKNTIRKAAARAAAPRLKVIIRRLAPGLTQAEFEAALGSDWTIESGRVDWISYCPGKISTSPLRPWRPSRAYMRLVSEAHLGLLAEKVRQTEFDDAKNTYGDSVLIGPPILEYAPYQKVSTGERRVDGRQGTIDQDAEFKSFLESLTAPVSKPVPLDNGLESVAQKPEKITTTPLIDHLREKKAGKEKTPPKANPKHSRADSKDSRGGGVPDRFKVIKAGKSDETSKADSDRKPTRAEKATPDTVRATKKDSHTTSTQDSSPKPPNRPASAAISTPKAPAGADRRRERGNTSVATMMLRRDLGISSTQGSNNRRSKNSSMDATKVAAEGSTTKETTGGEPPSRPSQVARTRSPRSEARPPRRPANAAAEKPISNASATGAATAPAPAPPTGPKRDQPSQPQPPRGPAADRNRGKRPAVVASRPAGRSGCRQAFLKHANASQGVTEPALQLAMAAFGPVDSVVIDRRKGFAYVDFATPVALRAAITASPVPVGAGAVVVLERQDRPGGGGGGAGGGGGGGGAGSEASRARRGGHRGGGRGPAPAASPAAAGSARKNSAG